MKGEGAAEVNIFLVQNNGEGIKRRKKEATFLGFALFTYNDNDQGFARCSPLHWSKSLWTGYAIESRLLFPLVAWVCGKN